MHGIKIKNFLFQVISQFFMTHTILEVCEKAVPLTLKNKAFQHLRFSKWRINQN